MIAHFHTTYQEQWLRAGYMQVPVIVSVLYG